MSILVIKMLGSNSTWRLITMLNHAKTTLSLLALVMILTVQAAMAQSLISGDISGTVTDPSGAGIPGASATATNRDTGVTQTTSTNQQGFYHFAFLRPGPYKVEVKANGFQTTDRIAQVEVGQVAGVDMQLPLASSSTTVEVTETTGAVQADNADLTTNINTAQLSLLPNSGNDMTYVALVAPGTVISTSGGYGNFSSYGLPATANLFTLNGQNDNDVYLNTANSGASNLMLGANELSEATVVNNGYSGQYGQLAGAQVNYLTKSGTNAFHGNAEWFWNGRALNANDWFNNANGVDRPFANANQWAASGGGPVIKNKTFFFVDYEGLRNILPTTTLAKIPSQQFEQTTLANLTATGQTAAVPFYQKMFSFYNSAPGAAGARTVPGGGCGNGFTALGAGVPCALQFQAIAGNFTKEYLWAARVDHHLSDRDQFFIRLWRDNGTQPTYTDPIAPIFNVFSPQPQMQGQVSETHTFSPTAINQLIFATFYYSVFFSPSDESAVLAAFPTTVRFSPALFSNMGGTGYNYPQGRKVTQYQFLDDFSKTYTNHTLKIGVNYRRYDINDFSFTPLSNGRITESNLLDFYNGGGTANSLQQRFPSATQQPLNIYQLGAYAQDEWRVARSLKVIASLRLDHDSNPVCGHDCFSRFVTPFTALSHDVNQPYNAAILSNQQQAFSGTDAVVWQPRLGFAWTPTKSGNTVLRGGFGFFESTLSGNIADTIARNLPGLRSFTVRNGKITPGVPGGLFAVASAANQSLLNAFSSGGTLASIKASNPLFATPSFTSTDATLKTPAYQEWNLEVQQALPSKLVLSLNYVGNHGIHELIQNGNLNAYGFGSLPATAPDPRFAIVNQYTSGGISNYNGLTTSLRRRFANGFQFQFNYTWSHALDECSNGCVEPYSYLTVTNQSLNFPENPYNIRQSLYGNADYDVRHYVSMNYVWQDALRHMFHWGPNVVFSGWTLSGTLFHRSGLPFSVVDTSVSGGIPNYEPAPFNAIFAQQIATGPTSCGKSSIDTPCFASNMFADPANFATQTRNQFRGPGYFNTDLAVLKEFKIPRSETMKLSIGAQFYNLFNHPNFDQPVGDFGQVGAGFGQIQQTVTPPTSVYGSFVGSAVSGRIIQTKVVFVF
jgi:hypothetical protein